MEQNRNFKRLIRWGAYAILLLIVQGEFASAQQITVPRIEQMPNRPSPYLMRDWKHVARGYDSLVFNLNAAGTYLPLSWVYANTINYPSHSSFGLVTVVGTTAPGSAEAVNCLPAIVSASLNGIDKSNQNGRNWALMAEEWFNNRPAQNVYKNHPTDDTGDDWWYETMPNVFFYQMNSFYPGTGDYSRQFTTVADRWRHAAQAMGGNDAPWHVPNMDHRGWFLDSMTPFDQSVHEPEAAGAIGWLEYNAWVNNGDRRYREAAEWSMEFLNGWSTNPSYELQLSYGVYTAARMNAELGTTYDLPKMLNWCFDVGPLRSWGAMVGNWGGYDCSGLIGEVNNNNDYAFAMNTFEQIGALMPVARYDARFARALGKWALNAANAARLFYPTGLPARNQDSYTWAQTYDPNGYIAHEAIRQSQGGATPFATGDAISGGWGLTTLTLYGSSHAGILGAIIDTTDVPMILKLDLLKTDYYHAPAYPSYLLFNPYDSAKTVTFDAGSGTHDLYDAATHAFLAHGVSGASALSIPGNSAVVVVVVPAGGTIAYDLERMSVNGITADYHSGHAVADYPPRIKALSYGTRTVLRNDAVQLYCTGTDRDGDRIHFNWSASKGTIVGADSTVRWIAPDSLDTVRIQTIIDDGRGGADTALLSIPVVAQSNNPPVINALTAVPRKLNLGSRLQITCLASDADKDTLSYAWSTASGSLSGSGASVQWTAPAIAGNYFIVCSVSDGKGGIATDSTGVEVRDFSQQQTGTLLAYFPFDGSAADASGNGHNGTAYAVASAPDRRGGLNGAYAFDGANSYVDVPNAPSLNVQNAISVNFWMSVHQAYVREQYPISHGNWPNRWKISISNGRVRFTVKTTAGTKDLDSETPVALNTNYNVTAVYNGADMELWLNGALDAFTKWSGSIMTTTYDLTIGQDLPNDQNYNFNGVLDDIRLYDYGLSPAEIAALAEIPTSVRSSQGTKIPERFELLQNYPNPFNPTTDFGFRMSDVGYVRLTVFNILGKEVATLVDGIKAPGVYHVQWNASGIASGVYFYSLRATSLELPYRGFYEVKKMMVVR